jgi:DNA-binding LacI/PurR family transcriptional regulator
MDAITNLARKSGPGCKLPTVRKMCAMLGVTSTTLQRSLRELETKGVITRRQGSGVYVSPDIGQKTIGLVFGRNVLSPGVSPNYLELLNQCTLRAADKGERFSFYIDIENVSPRLQGTPIHRDLAEAITQGKLAGLLVACTRGPSWEKWLRNQGVPMIRYGHLADVHPDGQTMARMAVDALAGAGCRSLGYMGCWRDELDAFHAHTDRRGLACIPEWIQDLGPTNPVWENRHEEFGYLTTQGLLAAVRQAGADRPLLPDGLVIADDMIAAGVCKAFDEAGIVIGRDIHIATQANKGSIVLRPWSERLFRLERDPAQTAAALFSALDALMEGTRSPHEKTAITPVLVAPTAPRLVHKTQITKP